MNGPSGGPSNATMSWKRLGWTRLGRALPFAIALTLITATAFALRPGARAPEIGLRDLSGRQITIAQLRGKVVLVDFWASWCEPCAAEMPVLDRLHQQYGRQGFSVIGVSQDRDVANVRQFLGRHRVSFPIVHDASHQVAGRYSPGRMPSSYLIDRNGVVRFVHEGYRASDAQALESESQRLLAQR